MQTLSERNTSTDLAITARSLRLSGKVQGVGFRPFVYRLALLHQLNGWVRNCLGSVEIHIQGNDKNIELFIRDVIIKQPPLASAKLESVEYSIHEHFEMFSILASDNTGDTDISVPTDLFLCNDCLAEINDPDNRRYRYPFTNCTQCGPRYTLIKQLPYDRANTSMASFTLCPACRREYEDPADRRFHAEPIACPDCGPTLSLHINTALIKNINVDDVVITDNETALNFAVDALHHGRIIAVKGIGGYHLMCDATDTQAIDRLRKNKPRRDKPLAVMFPAPADDVFYFANKSVSLNDADKAFLLQPSRPILLVEKKSATNLSAQLAPGLGEIGVMLPYSPLHHLLLNDFGGPLVATSANISGEPVLTDNAEIEVRLAHIADAFLHHDRKIIRPADDPVYKNIAGKARPMRTGRGCSPLEFTLPFELQEPVIAVGAQMKNTITLAWRNRAIISPHIGEMDSPRSLQVFENTVNDLQKLYEVQAHVIICDAHPGYSTTRWAHKQTLPVHKVLHHHAHASAAYYECDTINDVIIFSWDGVGYGDDATLWGGETFLGRPGQWNRVASMRPFRLPGGDKVSREPWRSAAALCWETGQHFEITPAPDTLIQQAWQKNINSPQTSSVGRLFDAAAALTGLRYESSFEGQGPMELEALCKSYNRSNEQRNKNPTNDNFIKLPLEKSDRIFISDWQPLITAMLDTDRSIGARASLFHSSMAQVILQQAIAIRAEHGVDTVSFSGGVFQNSVLTEQALKLLSENNFKVYLAERIPVNDADISFGQVMEYGFGCDSK